MKSIFCHKAKAAPPAANTLRFEFSSQSYSPVTAGVGGSGTWKRCEFMPGNVWDWTNGNDNWQAAFSGAFTSNDNVTNVIATGDISQVTNARELFLNCSSLRNCCSFMLSSCTTFYYMFRFSGIVNIGTIDTSAATNLYYMLSGCPKLNKITLTDTSSVTNFEGFANGCESIKEVPLLNTSVAINVTGMFKNCKNVETGALALYTQMSSQSTPPGTHTETFSNCGRNTMTGAAELAQIPKSWGGTKEEA